MAAAREVGWGDYARAERFLPWNAERLAFGLEIQPAWSESGDACWYRVMRRGGPAFMRIDFTTGKSTPAFDHDRLAAALSRTIGSPFDARALPFESIELAAAGSSVSFAIGNTNYSCDLATYDCSATGLIAPEKPDVVRSPDGTWEAFSRDDNLWVRNVATGAERAVTSGGETGNGFGAALVSPLVTAGLDKADKPAAVWSPDSKRLLTCKIDEREALKFHLVQSIPPDGGVRPKLHTYSYPLPGDTAVPQIEYWVADIAAESITKIDLPLLPMLYYGSPLNESATWWSADSDRVFFLVRDRGYLSYRLIEANTSTGETREVLKEEGTSGVDPFLYWAAINVRVIAGGSRAVWYSHRDGWPHLYLYDTTTGEQIRQLTSGTFSVSEITHVDEANRQLYFMGLGREAGRDPYYAHLYRVGLEGSEPELLTPEDAEHSISFSPTGNYFIDTFSRVDLPPTSVLRNASGEFLGILEESNIDALLETGWRMPERFTAKARDGITDVYGVIFRPTNFDPNESYPVIDNIYGGPQINQAPTSFADSKRFGGVHRAGRGRGFWHAQAIAELGFIVVMVDGMGMPGRSKAYHDVTYKDLGDGGLPDHITALRQLGDRYPYFDLDRVAIFGHSAGGYASVHAIFTYPDFYKVCVSSAGNHDHRLDKAVWVERYMGFPVEEHYVEQANQNLASGLEGKLLLIHGEMDENVHPASTMVVVDELIKANKDFDLLIIPNTPHFCDGNPYFVRRRWDYFVRHLHHTEPPAGYCIKPA